MKADATDRAQPICWPALSANVCTSGRCRLSDSRLVSTGVWPPRVAGSAWWRGCGAHLRSQSPFEGVGVPIWLGQACACFCARVRRRGYGELQRANSQRGESGTTGPECHGYPSSATWGEWERLLRTDPAVTASHEFIKAQIRDARVTVLEADEEAQPDRTGKAQADFVPVGAVESVRARMG